MFRTPLLGPGYIILSPGPKREPIPGSARGTGPLGRDSTLAYLGALETDLDVINFFYPALYETC